jgi:hypothetical protein
VAGKESSSRTRILSVEDPCSEASREIQPPHPEILRRPSPQVRQPPAGIAFQTAVDRYESPEARARLGNVLWWLGETAGAIDWT